MDYKKINKSIARFVGWLGLITCSFIIKLTPLRYLYALARVVSFIGYRIASKQRRVALDSLTTAFGKEKTESEIKQIAKDCFGYIAKSGMEMFYLMDKPKMLNERVKIAGKENLDQALSFGKGAILVSAHFGNFPLMLAKLAVSGYKTAGIMRHMRDERAEKEFSKMRARLNIKTIYSQPRNACVGNTLASLHNNELIFIPLDQNFGTGGVFVDFFGTKAATATGPVVLARRTKTKLLPCFIIREKDDTHTIIFEPALELEEAKTAEESIFINVQKLTNIIERYVRKYPAEWGWIHRRWKSRPN